jgi:hypothetical protein
VEGFPAADARNLLPGLDEEPEAEIEPEPAAEEEPKA